MNVPLNILLIEDDPDDVMFVREALRTVSNSSYQLLRAERLETGLEYLASTTIDLILLDLSLPDNNGLAAVQKIRAKQRNIPIVVLTGLNDHDLAKQAIHMGAQDYLVKGHFDEHSLDGAIRNGLERHRLLAGLQASEMKLRQIIENNADSMIVVDQQGTICFANPAAQALFGKEEHSLIGELFGFPITSGDSSELEIPSRQGKLAIVEMRTTELNWESKGASLVSLRDVTERKQAEEFLRGLSFLDELTGLYNRRGFFKLARNQLKLAKRDGSCTAIFFADIDKLKYINDTYGHPAGDQALIAIAEILKKTFRSTDIISRLGGDEFAVMAIKVRADNVPDLCRRIKAHTLDFNQQGKNPFTISFSTGTALCTPGNPLTLEELLAEADASQYKEKRKKRGES